MSYREVPLRAAASNAMRFTLVLAAACNRFPARSQSDDLARLARLCPPVTSDTRCSDIRWSAPDAYGGRTGTSNQPPSLPPSFDPSTLRGQFLLTVIATAGLPANVRDTVRTGRLTLQATDTVHRVVRCEGGVRRGNRDIDFPLFGSMDPRFQFPEQVGSPSNHNFVDEPSVVAEFDSAHRRLSLIFDNPYVRMFDSGVFLEVFHADSNSFTGRWVDGGLVVASGQLGTPTHEQGHFCATRVPH